VARRCVCVIKKPRERRGHSRRWAVEPEEIKTLKKTELIVILMMGILVPKTC
jgi:hypothetical protein